jgi:hypothetical protein
MRGGCEPNYVAGIISGFTEYGYAEIEYVNVYGKHDYVTVDEQTLIEVKEEILLGIKEY